MWICWKLPGSFDFYSFISRPFSHVLPNSDGGSARCSRRTATRWRTAMRLPSRHRRCPWRNPPWRLWGFLSWDMLNDAEMLKTEEDIYVYIYVWGYLEDPIRMRCINEWSFDPFLHGSTSTTSSEDESPGFWAPVELPHLPCRPGTFCALD
jgi:hypothetical protein